LQDYTWDFRNCCQIENKKKVGFSRFTAVYIDSICLKVNAFLIVTKRKGRFSTKQRALFQNKGGKRSYCNHHISIVYKRLNL